MVMMRFLLLLEKQFSESYKASSRSSLQCPLRSTNNTGVKVDLRNKTYPIISIPNLFMEHYFNILLEK